MVLFGPTRSTVSWSGTSDHHSKHEKKSASTFFSPLPFCLISSAKFELNHNVMVQVRDRDGYCVRDRVRSNERDSIFCKWSRKCVSRSRITVPLIVIECVYKYSGTTEREIFFEYCTMINSGDHNSPCFFFFLALFQSPFSMEPPMRDYKHCLYGSREIHSIDNFSCGHRSQRVPCAQTVHTSISGMRWSTRSWVNNDL